MKTLPVFVLTVKNSIRESQIKKRLDYLKIKYKIIYAVNGHNKENYNYLNKIYDKKKSHYLLGRYLSYPEISNAEGHLNICKIILKKKIKNAIIMEDDCYPSKELKFWIKQGGFFNNNIYDVIQFYHKFGLVTKNPVHKIKKFGIYKTCFTVPYATCYQVSMRACEFFVNKNKFITRNADWPINLYNSGLKQFVILPHIASVYYAHESTSCQKKIWDTYRSTEKIKKMIPFYNILTAFYFIFHIPFLLGKQKDYSFYKEHYLLRKFYFIKNLIVKKYINLEDTFYDRSLYPKDLKDNFDKLIKTSIKTLK